MLHQNSRTARNALVDQEVSVHLRLPQRQFYKLAIFARDRLTSPKHEHSPATEGVFQYSFEKVLYSIQAYSPGLIKWRND